MPTIVWDFDYTLFDAAAFKDDLKRAVVRQGVTPERFDQAYRQVVKRQGKTYDYDPVEHLRLLAEDLGSVEAAEAARRGIQAVLSDTRRYLYPDAEAILGRLKEAGARQLLLTLGNKDWQSQKVANAGLEPYFDRIVPFDGDKAEMLGRLAEMEGELVVVNDNGREVKSMRDRWPELKYILVAGPKETPEGLELIPAKGLLEAERMIGLTAPPKEGDEARLSEGTAARH